MIVMVMGDDEEEVAKEERKETVGCNYCDRSTPVMMTVVVMDVVIEMMGMMMYMAKEERKETVGCNYCDSQSTIAGMIGAFVNGGDDGDDDGDDEWDDEGDDDVHGKRGKEGDGGMQQL